MLPDDRLGAVALTRKDSRAGTGPWRSQRHASSGQQGRAGDDHTGDALHGGRIRTGRSLVGQSARAERAGDRGRSASPEALDLIEARFAERAQLNLERKVAILV
jgi:hypothetical protein